MAVRSAPVLREEIAVLLAKDAIEPVPPAEMRQGFYSPYFIVPKKGGGLWPILDLRVLNRALHKLPFKMLTHRRMIKCIQPQDWFAAIDLKDAYIHVSILPRHRPTVCVRRSGMAVQGPHLRTLPVSQCVHEGCRGHPYPVTGSGRQDPQLPRRLAYPSPIQRAESRADHRDLVLRHLSQLALWVNWEKSKLSPVQRISFLGVELDSVSMTVRLTEECSAELPKFLQRQECCTTETVSEAPGAYGIRSCSHAARIASYETTSALATLPVPRWAWRRSTLRVGISLQCRRSLSPWTDLAFLRAGVPLEQVSRHTVVTTDASSTGWGATCNGQAALGLWTGPQLLWHINCLELWAVHLALRQFRPLLLGKRMLVRTDALAHSWPRALREYAFPPVSLLAQTLCKLREDEEQVLLVAPHWPIRTWFPELISLATAPPWRIPLRKDLLSQGLGTIWHPRPDLWNLHVWLLDGTWQT